MAYCSLGQVLLHDERPPVVNLYFGYLMAKTIIVVTHAGRNIGRPRPSRASGASVKVKTVLLGVASGDVALEST
jgi:hypothetical protein